METVMLRRLLDAIAILLALAPFVNAYFLIQGVRRFRHDPEHSPVLLVLVIVLVAIWLLGVVSGMAGIAYLLQPPRTPTLAGLLFGIILLLVQAVPHYVQFVMRRIERGHG